MSISRRDLYAMGEPFGDSATQAKASGGRIYGGGGGGGGGDSVSTQIVDLPAWATEYGKEGLASAQALTNLEQNPYKTYTGDRTAGFSGLQQTAMQNAYNMAPSTGTNAAMGLAGAAGLNALNTQYDPASFNVNQLQTGSFTQPGAASAYMNPYMQNVVDIQKREAQNQADIAGTSRGAQAVKAGAFGGSRQAIMDAEAQRNLSQQMNDIQAKGSSAAYNQAMQQFNAEQQLGLTAQTGNQQQNLEAQKLVEQSRQYGAGQGMQGLQTALTGAGQLANIGQQQFGQEMSINQLQNQYGAQQQAMQQQGLDTQYQDFLNQQRYPYQQLEFMNSILRGTPMGTVQSMYQPAPSALSQIAGLGTAAYGVSQMAEGGEVPGYAVGGGITGLLNDPQLQQRMQSPTISQLARMAAQDEMQARAQMRAGATAQQAPQGEQPTVADEYMMSRGVAALPTGEINMAGGGILAFAEGDSIPGPQSPFERRLEDFKKSRVGQGLKSAGLMPNVDEEIKAQKLRQALAEKYGASSGIPGAFKAQSGEERKKATDILNNLDSMSVAEMEQALSGAAPVAEGEPGSRENPFVPTGSISSDAMHNRRRKAAADERALFEDDPADEETDTPRSMAKRPTRSTMSLEDVRAMNRVDPNTRQALIDRVDLANVANEDVYKQGIANLKRDQDELGEFGTEREAKLKEQEAGLAGLEKRNQSMAFIEAGLAIMSGNSANAFENIGKGALVGTKAYKEGMDKIDTKRTKLDDAFMNLYDIRRGEKVANKKDLRAAETAFEQAKAQSEKALADVSAKFYDADRADARAATEAYVKMKEGEANRASNEYRTQLTADATLNAAILRAAKSQGLTEKDLIGMRQKAQTLVQQRIKDTPGLAQRIQNDPSIREKLMRDALAEVGVPGASGGQDDAGDVTMNFDAQGNPI